MELSQMPNRKKRIEKKVILFIGIMLPLVLLGHILHDRYQSRDVLHEANQAVFAEWFGSDSPEMFMLMQRWEDEGLIGILNMEEEADVLRDRIENNVNHTVASGEREWILTNVDLILNGGFPLLDEENFDAERFISAIVEIEKAIDGSNIFIRWHMLLHYGAESNEN